jgi:MarR family 2-MHQ and catechol resistance regulon transcriptional repressor
MYCKKIFLSSSSITNVVDKLEKKGHFVRKDCPKDRRVTYAVIINSGKKFMDEVFPEHKKIVDSIFEALSEEELETSLIFREK